MPEQNALPPLNAFLWWSAKPIVLVGFKVLFRYRVEGRQHLPRRGPLLVVANHLSHLDPPLIGLALPRTVRFLARENLRRAPVVGGLIRRWGIIPVYRDSQRRAYSAVEMALEALRRGEAVAIFPEGTRSEDGRFHPEKVRSGAAVLALRSRAPVVPAGIWGTCYALPKGAKWIRPRPVGVRFGPPIQMEDLYDRGLSRDVTREATRRILEAIQDLLPEEHRAEKIFVPF